MDSLQVRTKLKRERPFENLVLTPFTLLSLCFCFRYSDSPVGPYDEVSVQKSTEMGVATANFSILLIFLFPLHQLIYVAGSFKSPETGTSGLRITNIVVSTEATMVSGRATWNIPKHLATFRFSHPVHSSSKETQTVEIYHPKNSPLYSSKPFFSAKLSPSSLPSLPINTNLFFFPSLPLFQPDLRQSDRYTDEKSNRSVIGTQEGLYKSTAPTFKGSFSLGYCQPSLKNEKGQESFGDGQSFPRAPVFQTGFHFKKVEVGFPLSKEFVVGDRKNV